MKGFVFAAATLVVVLASQRAGAVCQNSGSESYRRLLVSQPDDIVFTAGVPETKYMTDVFVTYNALPITGFSDCGVIASSSIQGISVQENYCAWDFPATCLIFPAGQWGPIDKSEPDAGSEPAGTYRYYDLDHLRKVAIIYDGVAVAGTKGTIDIAMQDENGLPVTIIGQVNVYIQSGTPAPTWLTVTANASNVSGDSLIIDNALINNSSSARVFAQHRYTSSNWNHPIAVWFDNIHWRIRNEDGVAMPIGLTFNVRVDPTALRLKTAGSNQPYYLIIDDPRSNNNPYATIIATPFSAGNRRMTHPFAVAYVSPHWQVSFVDGTPMPTSYTTAQPFRHYEPGFFVKIIDASQYIDDGRAADPSGFSATNRSNGAGVDIVGNLRVSGNKKILNQFCWTTTILNPIITTFVMTALPPPAPVNYNTIESKFYGIGTLGSALTVFHEDGTTMYGNTSFNVWGPYRADCPPTYP